MTESQFVRFRLEVKPNGTMSRLWLNGAEVSPAVRRVEVVTEANGVSVLRVEYVAVEGEIEGEARLE